MARNHGRIFTSIWSDTDWLQRTGNAQRLYMLMLSQSNLNHAGVIPLQVNRWRRCCQDWSPENVAAALAELEESKFIVMDADTEEVLIRSYIRRDGVWSQPNVLKSALGDVQAVLSVRIQGTLRAELMRLPLSDPKPAITAGLEDARRVAETLPEIPRNPSDNPSRNPSTSVQEPFPEPPGEGEGEVEGESPAALVVDKRRPQQSRGTRLPPDWNPDETLTEWTRINCPDVDVAYTAAVFGDYWRAQPGQKGVKLDWDGTWRNWTRREQQNVKAGRPGTATPSGWQLPDPPPGIEPGTPAWRKWALAKRDERFGRAS